MRSKSKIYGLKISYMLLRNSIINMITSIVICCFIINKLECQNFQLYYNAFANVKTPTGILLNKGFVNPSFIQPFINSDDPRVIISNSKLWAINYEMLRKSNSNPNFILPELKSFYQEPAITSNVVKISGFYIDADYIEPEALFLNFNRNTKEVPFNTPTKMVNIASMVNLRASAANNQLLFKFDTAHFFTNKLKSDILGLSIDFDDGRGEIFQNFRDFSLPIHYNSTGTKKLTFKIITRTGVITTYSNILIVPHQNFTNTRFHNIKTTLPNGNIQEGFYSIDVSCDGVLDKPVIIVEGFDPLNKIDSTESQQKYYSAGLLSYFIEFGYDVIGLQFKNNNDYLQNNAAIVKKLIEEINSKKRGNYELIIIGESNGGLNTRIALAEMEKNNIDHQVGLYISFDTPHAGANIPLGVQELGHDSQDLDFFSTPLFSLINPILGPGSSFVGLFVDLFGGNIAEDILLPEDIKKTIQSNRSPAALQQMIRHREYPNAILNPNHTAFQHYLKELGYPDFCRKIALINGSNTGRHQNAKFLERAMDMVNIDAFVFSADGYALISPINTPSEKVSAIKISALFFDILDEEGVFNFSTPIPFDLAPGGITKNSQIKRNYAFSLTASTIDLAESVRYNFYGSHYTDSGLFYYDESSNDDKRKKAYLIENKLSPFDDIYANSENTDHISYDEIGNLVEKINIHEFMFERMYLQNRTIDRGKERQFHATQRVYLGRNVNELLPGKQIKKLDFVVQAGSEVKVTAGDFIQLQPGTTIYHGASFHASINNDSSDCKSFFSSGINVYKEIVPIPIIEKEFNKDRNQTTFRVKNPYKKTTARDYSWLLVGNGWEQTYIGYEFSVNNLEKGTYCIVCSLFDGQRTTTKYFEIHAGDADNMTVLVKEDKMGAGILNNGAKLRSKTMDFTFYPNPVNETLIVDFKDFGGIDGIIKITDSVGRNILQVEKPGEKKLELSLSTFKPGIYFLTFESKKIPPISKKFIVAHSQ